VRYLNTINLRVLLRAARSPATAWRQLQAGFADRPDRVFAEQVHWRSGQLPRVGLTELFPDAPAVDIQVLRAPDRTFGMSLTVEELACVLVIAKVIRAKRVLEIGTWDGNTALNIATNIEGTVTTVDLPKDQTNRESAIYPGTRLNLGDRNQLGRQFAGCDRVQQVYGDSATLDWSTFGGPFDLIFIDGCHDKPYVESDTANAFKVLAEDGVILWHDYGMLPAVSEVVDALAGDHPVWAIEGTRLAVQIRRPHQEKPG
jgi:predicted O-methyltransferase YrrM